MRIAWPSRGDLGEALAHGGDDGGREPFEGLVEQQHVGIERERPRDGEHLALAAAHLGALARHVAPERREHSIGELDPLGGGPAARPRPRRDLDVLGHRQVGEDAAVLGREAEPQPRDLVGAPPVDRLAVERGCGPRAGAR